MIREQLLAAYARHGIEIRTGQAVAEFLRTGGFDRATVLAECASAWRDGRRLDTGWGMSWSELSVLEFLADIWSPRAIFGIGNGFGWSAVAMRLLWPGAWLAVLDDASEGKDAESLRHLTNEILGELGGGLVVLGKSPDDVPWASKFGTYLAPFSLVLIDGFHSNEQQTLDFDAVRPFLADEHIVLFHDVMLLGMRASFDEIARGYPGRSAILHRTTTGMGMVWSGDAGARVAGVFGGYA